jgi:RNA polymerase sigma-70 factor (ECF subfamily)
MREEIGDQTARDRTAPGSALDRASAFGALAERQLPDAYRVARLILGNSADAEDATHDAFVAAWRGFAGLRDPERFDAWFGRILINTCRNRLRRERPHTVVDVSFLLAAPDPTASFIDRAEIETAYATLSFEHREVIVLRYFLDLPVDGIAVRVGVPAGTVKSRLHHALRLLGASLEAQRREVGR